MTAQTPARRGSGTEIVWGRVVLAGVVFNGLCDDLQNWSSYGPSQSYGDDGLPTARRGIGVVEEEALVAG